MPPPSDQTPAIAYGIYSQEPVRTPGGGLTMPPMPSEALTAEAELDRLRRASARAQTILVDWFDRLSVFGVSAQFDIDRFERAVQALWRLTAIAKSIKALVADPSQSLPPELEPNLNAALSDIDAISSAGVPPASSSLGPRTTPSANAPASQTATPSPTTPSSTTLTADSSPRSALATPHLSARPTPSVRAVPSCPTLSREGIATCLTRTESDLAEATRPTPPILDLPPTPDKSHPSLSPSPRSALATPPLEDPYVSCGGACLECDKPFCNLRHMAPFLHPSSPLKCDGACRDCSSLHTCPYPPACLRPG